MSDILANIEKQYIIITYLSQNQIIAKYQKIVISKISKNSLIPKANAKLPANHWNQTLVSASIALCVWFGVFTGWYLNVFKLNTEIYFVLSIVNL